MSVPNANAVVLEGVRLDRGGRTILRDLDLAIPQGSITAVLGPSGTGKSTLLAALTGELVPAAGRVQVFGRDVPRGARALLEMRKGIGVLLQGNGLLTDLSVAENVALPLRAHARLPEPLLGRLVDMKLNAVGLRGAAGLYPRELSGGMARRVALARAIALDPELIMYDEPFAGLDPISLGTAARLIRTLNDALGLTSIVVSHDLEETFRVADQVIILGAGGVAAQGTPAEVMANPDPLVQQFVHAQPIGPVPFHYPAPSLAQDFGGQP